MSTTIVKGGVDDIKMTRRPGVKPPRPVAREPQGAHQLMSGGGHGRWDEHKHPRSHGKFTSGAGGGAAGGSAPAPRAPAARLLPALPSIPALPTGHRSVPPPAPLAGGVDGIRMTRKPGSPTTGKGRESRGAHEIFGGRRKP